MSFVQYVSHVKFMFCVVQNYPYKILYRFAQNLHIRFEASLESKRIMDYNSSVLLYLCSNDCMIDLEALRIFYTFTQCIELQINSAMHKHFVV